MNESRPSVSLLRACGPQRARQHRAHLPQRNRRACAHRPRRQIAPRPRVNHRACQPLGHARARPGRHVPAPDLPRLMERLTNVDLRSAEDGAATRTVIDHLGCYLIKRSASEISLYCPRSSAQSLHHAMIIAAQSLV